MHIGNDRLCEAKRRASEIHRGFYPSAAANPPKEEELIALAPELAHVCGRAREAVDKHRERLTDLFMRAGYGLEMAAAEVRRNYLNGYKLAA
jgi:hypothetical protein